MTNKRATKRALLTSVLAICLCLVMLIGSTFAWFTDTASTGVNKIQAGNLDVQLLMREGNEYTNIGDSKNPIFGAENSEVAQNNNQDTLWEPGKTQVAYLAVRNAGNLALKYNINLNVVDNGLAKALEYVIVPQGTQFGTEQPTGLTDVANWDAVKTTAAQLPTTGTYVAAPNGCLDEIAKGSEYSNETEYFALVVHMKEDAGNTYMDKTVTIDIQVQATQAAAESDSFNNTYDESATLPTYVANQEKLNETIQNADSDKPITVALEKGTYKLPGGDKMTNKNVTITGTTETVINVPEAVGLNNATITMDGVTVQSPNANYTGLQHTTATIFKNCVIKGQPFLYAKDAQFINCTFEQDSSDAYNVWTYGAENVLFKGCTFNCAGKAVLIYNEGSIPGQTVEFQNCKFSASASVDGKAAIEIDSSLLMNNATYTVIIDQATADSGVTGFSTGSVSGNSVWNNKKGERATVIVGGMTVLTAKA